MATAADTIKKLLDASTDLERQAQQIQGDRDLQASDDDIDNLISAYQQWYARALDVLPPEYQDRFRQEYEGNWHSSKIKNFLAGPGDQSPFWTEEAPFAVDPLLEQPLRLHVQVPAVEPTTDLGRSGSEV